MSIKLLGFMGRAVLSKVFPTRIFIISSKFRTRTISTILKGPVVSLDSRLIYLKLTPRHSNTPMIAKAWPRHLATGTADGITSGVVCAPPPRRTTLEGGWCGAGGYSSALCTAPHQQSARRPCSTPVQASRPAFAPSRFPPTLDLLTCFPPLWIPPGCTKCDILKLPSTVPETFG